MVDGLRVCSWLQWKRENAAKQPAAPVSGAGSPPPPAAPAGGDGGGGSDGAADGTAAAADNVEAPAMPEGLSKMEQMKVSMFDRPYGWCESSHCPQCRGFNARG